MTPARRHSFEVFVGIAVMVLGVGFVYMSYASSKIKQVQGYELSARFSRIGTIQLGAPVKIAGVDVGRVARMTLDKDNKVTVVFTVEPQVKVPVDSLAAVTTDGLLGGKYIKLEPGADKQMLPAGATIAKTKDALSVEEMVGKIVVLAVGSGEDKDKKK